MADGTARVRVAAFWPLAAVALAGIGVTAALVVAQLAGPSPPATPAPVALPAGEAAVSVAAFRIPALGITSPVVPLVLAPDRRLDPPADPQVVGWYTDSAVPGRRGPAVLTGHIDSRRGPGVFHRLPEVPVGAPIEVDLTDGRTIGFRVVSVARADKDEFPTDAVYGPVPVPVLRVISCTGRFDTGDGHYEQNVIVTAVPA